jgi:predicted transcriptional regulator
LRQKKIKEIVFIILVNKKAKFQFLAESLKLPASTISLYLKYLVDNQIIEKTKIGYENIYTIKDEDRIAKILIAYKSSFLDKIVDRMTSTWLETRFTNRRIDETKPDV